MSVSKTRPQSKYVLNAKRQPVEAANLVLEYLPVPVLTTRRWAREVEAMMIPGQHLFILFMHCLRLQCAHPYERDSTFTLSATKIAKLFRWDRTETSRRIATLVKLRCLHRVKRGTYTVPIFAPIPDMRGETDPEKKKAIMQAHLRERSKLCELSPANAEG